MKQTRAGFSVIEAVIAIAIAAIGLTAILSLQQQLASSQARDEAVLQRLNIRRAALVLIKDINPMQTPDGQVEIAPGLNLSWTSDVIMPTTQGIGFAGALSPFRVGLYDVNVRISDANKNTLDQFKVERMGWARSNDVLEF